MSRRALSGLILLLSPLLGEAQAFDSPGASPLGLPGIELERLTLQPGGQGSLLLNTGALLPRGGYRLSFTGHYESQPFVLFEEGERLGAVVQQRVTGHLAGAYSPTHWLELSAQVPLLIHQRGDDLTDRGIGTPSVRPGLGTPYLGVRFGLLAQANSSPLDLSVGALLGLPVGSADALSRDKAPRLLGSMAVGRHLGSVRTALEAGVLLRARTVLSEDDHIQDEVGNALRLGAVLATPGEGLRGELNVMASIPFRREGKSVEALSGMRLPLGEALEFYAVGGVGFGDAPGTPTFRGLLGVAYGHTPSPCVTCGQP